MTKTCSDCKHYGVNVWAGIDSFCWQGRHRVDKDADPCVIFQKRSDENETD